MSREGVAIAARDRARRLQAALGEGATVLLGCTLVVLQEPPRQALAAAPQPDRAANDAHGGAERPPATAAERVR
jgi:hypothetical protein